MENERNLRHPNRDHIINSLLKEARSYAPEDLDAFLFCSLKEMAEEGEGVIGQQIDRWQQDHLIEADAA